MSIDGSSVYDLVGKVTRTMKEKNTQIVLEVAGLAGQLITRCTIAPL